MTASLTLLYCVENFLKCLKNMTASIVNALYFQFQYLVTLRTKIYIHTQKFPVLRMRIALFECVSAKTGSGQTLCFEEKTTDGVERCLS